MHMRKVDDVGVGAAGILRKCTAAETGVATKLVAADVARALTRWIPGDSHKRPRCRSADEWRSRCYRLDVTVVAGHDHCCGSIGGLEHSLAPFVAAVVLPSTAVAFQPRAAVYFLAAHSM